jgi:hypothetical protein
MHSCFVSKLHMAVTVRNRAWVKRLLQEGYDPNVDTRYDFPLLHLAILNGDIEIAEMLKEAGATASTSLVIESCTERWVFEWLGSEVTVNTTPLKHPKVPAV